VRRAHKFLLRPTGPQHGRMVACLEDHRQLYNGALEHRRAAYRMRAVSVRYGDQSAELKAIRRDDPSGQGRWSFSSQQATLRRLDKAMSAFFRRVKAGQTPGYPRFKGRGWFDSVTWPADGDGCRWDSASSSGQVRLYLQGVGHVRVHAHRPVKGRVKTITIKREGRRWYVVLSCQDVPAEPLEPTGAVVGIDMGVASLLTTSDGVHVANPRHLAASARNLTRAQQALARCTRGSNRRRKQRAQVVATHRRIRRQRLDHAHKTALSLVRRYDLIAHENLRIANMTRSAAGTVQAPGRNVAAKRGLNRLILDAGWGVFLSILAAKAESAGRTLIAVDPANTSRTCTRCGYCAAGNRLTQAEFRCLACGFAGHADQNAATNILRAGLARQAAQSA
jgi:putative transposase